MPPISSLSDPFLLDCRGLPLDCRSGRDGAPHVMGILNITPDSFSDGGRFLGRDDALRRVETMLEEGAVIVDIGGESTRPRGSVYGVGASAVDLNEELRRVVPVIEAVVSRFSDVIVSIDTYKPEVAREALAAGAHVINDVTGLRLYPETADVAAEAGAPIIVMHSLGRPGDLPHEHHYGDVVSEVVSSLADSIRRAEAAGVAHIVSDPGFGFGKSVEENLALVRETRAFVGLGRPVLLGISRKSTIGAVLESQDAPRPVHDRLFGTLGATAVGVLAGASIVRTHDVRETADFLRTLRATAYPSVERL